MKNLASAGLAVCALTVGGAAMAADMRAPIYKAPPAVWSWSGFYIGGNAGYARANSSWNDLDGFINFGGPLSNETTTGFTGGGQIGYNWQFGHAVLGAEADFDYVGINNTTTLFALFPGFEVPLNDRIRWVGTVRARSGLAVDNVLLYLTGGLAYGRTNHSFVENENGETDDALAFGSTRAGYVVGGGMEYGLTPQWSLKTEVLYIDLGKTTGVFGPDADASGMGRFEVMDTMWVARMGINYTFGR